jgi:hypothetical protein
MRRVRTAERVLSETRAREALTGRSDPQHGTGGALERRGASSASARTLPHRSGSSTRLFFTRALPRIRWMLRPLTPTYYFRRTIEMRAGIAEHIVYAVQPIEGNRPDPVPVIAAYPAEWVPTEFPGQCLFDRDAPAGIYETFVPRSQFRHYRRITRQEAAALYPTLSGSVWNQ